MLHTRCKTPYAAYAYMLHSHAPHKLHMLHTHALHQSLWRFQSNVYNLYYFVLIKMSRLGLVSYTILLSYHLPILSAFFLLIGFVFIIPDLFSFLLSFVGIAFLDVG